MKFKFLAKEKINTLPKTAGVYGFFAGKKILYLGKSVNLKNRVKQHRVLLNQVKHIAYIKTDSEMDALLLESRLIKKYQPKYNVMWKDDKNYFYVGIGATDKHLPRVFITHQTTEKCSRYIGPFVDGKTLKETLKNLRKIFPYYTQKKHPNKLCPWCHLRLCPGHNPDPKKYRQNIRKLTAVLEGKRKLQENPVRMEGYDISNIQGQFATGSMVTFVNGRPDKNFYRRFKIKITGKPNDVAMLKEVLTRRFNHPEWPYPDLILIDGGRAQLNAALEIQNSKFKFQNDNPKFKIISLAKKKNEVYIENKKRPIRLNSLPDSQKFVLMHLRDEAHRFAISYHKKLRLKGLLGN